MNPRTITAIFDSPSDAQEAQARLLSLGLPEDDVRLVSNGATDARADQHKGFWESIKDFFVADADRATYSEGLRRGGCLLTARVDEAHADEAIAILESTKAVDLEEREQQWRSEGWTGAEYETGGAQYSQAPELNEGAERSRASRSSDAQYSQGADAEEEAIPIVRERLRVGKRDVNRGGVRVRSYIVEEPVSEQVELREEHVEVERRPTRRGTSAAEASDLLRERTIEVTERGEEAVVAKEAEVTEEVVVRKFEGHRTEGVSDTVRRTEVEVDDTRVDPSTAQPPSTRSGSRRGRSDSKPAR